MLNEAFDVQYLADIPARIRNESKGRSRALVYISHEVLIGKHHITPQTILLYLDLINSEAKQLFWGNHYAVIGVAFIVKQPDKLKEVIEKCGLLDKAYQYIKFTLLDELRSVTRRDLLDFLQTHDISVPTDRIDKVLDTILAKTKGVYEPTIEALERVVQGLWDHGDIPGPAPLREAPEYD